MAGIRGGLSRRSHTKSRKGCETCKRRHIRCDENFPQCRNCTKYKVCCPYSMQVTKVGLASSPDKPDLMWTLEIETAVAKWQATGVFPFSFLREHSTPKSHLYSIENLRLIYHVANMYSQLSACQGNKFTLWTHHIPTLLEIGATTPYVMHALLAFSATHIAFVTNCSLVSSIAIERRGVALSGLHKAMGTFSNETSDALLAASMLLSWQATDWCGWVKLMQGTSTVINAMDSWKHESQFVNFIAENATFSSFPPSSRRNHQRTMPSDEDIQAFQRAIEQVQKIESHLKHCEEETAQVQTLISFLQRSQWISPRLSLAQQYKHLQPLRTWLFWMPVDYLQSYHGSPNSLVLIAHLYTVALFVERLFPEISEAFFGSSCTTLIAEIVQHLITINTDASFKSEGLHETPLTLMDFFISNLSNFNCCLNWEQAEEPRSLPPANLSDLPVNQGSPLTGNPPSDLGIPFGDIDLSYTPEVTSMVNNGVFLSSQIYPVWPMMLSPTFWDRQTYTIPLESTFLRSTAYTDTEEYTSCDLSVWV